MKKALLGLIFISTFSYAQNGIEKIIVEEYYVANAADEAFAATESIGPGNALPAGSVTYRIYVDMAPGYKLIQLFALQEYKDPNLVKPTLAAHPLKFRTSTSFYNNPNGDYIPSFKKSGIKNNLLALDSWLTLGGVASGNAGSGGNNFGIRKEKDNGLLNNVTSNNTDGILLNTDASVGIPLTTQDGMILATAGRAFPTPSFAGFGQNEFDAIADGSVLRDSLVVIDGNMYSTGLVQGPIEDSTVVLVAQLTTNGILTFELNVLVQNIKTSVGEYFVAKNEQYNYLEQTQQYTLPSLTYLGKPVNIPTSAAAIQTFNIYPNPAKDLLTIEINSLKQNKNNEYTIYSVLGNVITRKTLAEISGSYQESIDISSLANGLYFIEVTLNGVSSTKKIIKN
jgi:hypothetical protein